MNLIQICTIPLDTAKVRLQLQKKAIAGDGVALPKYRGLLGTVGTIAREEGLSALWKGIVPGLHRQCLFGGLRIGLYEPVGLESSPQMNSCVNLYALFGYWFLIYVPTYNYMLNRSSPFMWVVTSLEMFLWARKFLLHLQLVSLMML